MKKLVQNKSNWGSHQTGQQLTPNDEPFYIIIFYFMLEFVMLIMDYDKLLQLYSYITSVIFIWDFNIFI